MPSPKLTFTLELLTPAVLGGPYPRRCDPYMPLRPASLRGLWRYWFRAAVASLLWPEPGQEELLLKELRKAESSLFGDTEQRSYFALRPPVGLRPGRLDRPADNSGLRYLGYGLFEDRDRLPDCLPANQTADVECVLRRLSPPHIEALLASVWLWSTFGGLGARSRRGWGSVRLKDVKGPGDIAAPWRELLQPAATPQHHLTRVNTGINAAYDAFEKLLKVEGLGRRFRNNDARGPHPAIRTLEGIANLHSLPHDFNSGLDALDHAGKLFREYRSTLARRARGQPPLPDYFDVKAALQSPDSIPRTIRRAAFGLPLRFYFRSLNGHTALLLPRLPDRQRSDRLASPLLFRVFALEKDRKLRYGLALINLAGKPHSPPLQGCELVLTSNGRPKPVQAPSSTLIHDFIDWAVQQPLTSSPPARRRR